MQYLWSKKHVHQFTVPNIDTLSRKTGGRQTRVFNFGPKFLAWFGRKVCLRADRGVKLGPWLNMTLCFETYDLI